MTRLSAAILTILVCEHVPISFFTVFVIVFCAAPPVNVVAVKDKFHVVSVIGVAVLVVVTGPHVSCARSS